MEGGHRSGGAKTTVTSKEVSHGLEAVRSAASLNPAGQRKRKFNEAIVDVPAVTSLIVV
jgi:hypothetical protein